MTAEATLGRAPLWRFLVQQMPALGLDPSAFGRVRGQVVKRLRRRLAVLGVSSLEVYRALLREPGGHERDQLRWLCRVTISRFFRNREVFEWLAARGLEGLAQRAAAGDGVVRCWSAACGAGEEPYSVSLAWSMPARGAAPGGQGSGPALCERFAPVELHIVATDFDAGQLQRARRASYPEGALRELPTAARALLTPEGHASRIPAAVQRRVTLRRHDLAGGPVDGRFDLVLCRNAVFSYFNDDAKRRFEAQLREVVVAGGLLILGRGERPMQLGDWEPGEAPCVYRRRP